MATLTILDVSIKPDRVDTMHALMARMVEGTRTFEGCLDFAAYTSVDDPTSFVFVERWVSRAHHERYSAWRADQDDSKVFAEICAAAPIIRYLDEIIPSEGSAPGA
jgi:quinol monooxygenase YgiN